MKLLSLEHCIKSASLYLEYKSVFYYIDHFNFVWQAYLIFVIHKRGFVYIASCFFYIYNLFIFKSLIVVFPTMCLLRKCLSWCLYIMHAKKCSSYYANWRFFRRSIERAGFDWFTFGEEPECMVWKRILETIGLVSG